jgi:hypothetical protein
MCGGNTLLLAQLLPLLLLLALSLLLLLALLPSLPLLLTLLLLVLVLLLLPYAGWQRSAGLTPSQRNLHQTLLLGQGPNQQEGQVVEGALQQVHIII